MIGKLRKKRTKRTKLNSLVDDVFQQMMGLKKVVMRYKRGIKNITSETNFKGRKGSEVV